MSALEIMTANKGCTVQFEGCTLKDCVPWTYDILFTWHGKALVGFFDNGDQQDGEYIEVEDTDMTPYEIQSFESFTVISDEPHKIFRDWSL